MFNLQYDREVKIKKCYIKCLKKGCNNLAKYDIYYDLNKPFSSGHIFRCEKCLMLFLMSGRYKNISYFNLEGTKQDE